MLIAGEAAKLEADVGFGVQCQFTQDAQNSHLIGCKTESEKQASRGDGSCKEIFINYSLTVVKYIILCFGMCPHLHYHCNSHIKLTSICLLWSPAQ